MKNGELIKTIAIQSGQNISPYVDAEAIERPGFYYNQQSHNIEHWSKPCEYTKIMSHAYRNRLELLCDGFLSTVSGSDSGEIAQQVKNWAAHLHKYGVEV